MAGVGCDWRITPKHKQGSTPFISSVSVLSTNNNAIISWATDEPASSRVEFGPSRSTGIADVAGLTRSHAVPLTGLAPGEHRFRVASTNAAGNTGYSEVGTFTTFPRTTDSHRLSTPLVEWVDDTHVRVTYDWSSAAQLSDWIPTDEASLAWSPSRVRISDGDSDVRGMIWSVPIRATSVAVVANPLQSGHVNIYANLSESWTGTPWNPASSVGHIWHAWGGLWTLNGDSEGYEGTEVQADSTEQFEFSMMSSRCSAWTSAGGPMYTREGVCQTDEFGRIAVGAYGADSLWGPIVVEGELGNSIAEMSSTMHEHSVDIEWTTNYPSTSVVEYGTTSRYGMSIEAAVPTKHHFVTLSKLNDRVVYHFRISSVSIGGHAASTADHVFSLVSSVPADEVVFEHEGTSFSALLAVHGGAEVLWTFDDGSTSRDTRLSKRFGTSVMRHTRLKVSPWSGLTAVNVGYDAADGGRSDIELHPQQNIKRVIGMSNMAQSLVTWASSNTPIGSLDFSNFISLQDIECAYCQSLTSVVLTNTPELRRACFEDNDLRWLDHRQSPALEDLRAARNAFTQIEWGGIGSQVWHICTRDNSQLEQDLPDLRRFPSLQELWIWNDNYHGELKPASTMLRSVLAQGNHFTSAQFSGCFAAGADGQVNLDDNLLTVLDVSDAPGLLKLSARNNHLSSDVVDKVLSQLAANATSRGVLDLTGNSPPTEAGRQAALELDRRGWHVALDPG